jgi:hypothetical protein
MMYENSVLRRIFGAKRDGVTREWRKLPNEEHNDLYSSPTIFRVIKSGSMIWVGHAARMVEGRDVYRVLVGKTEGMRTQGRHRRRREDNIKVDLQKMGCGVWTVLVWLRIDRWLGLVNAVINLRIP